MAKFKFTLSIGFCRSNREKIVDIDIDDCETSEEKQAIIDEVWQDWANTYIDGGAEEIK